jgi:hypothetical protein
MCKHSIGAADARAFRAGRTLSSLDHGGTFSSSSGTLTRRNNTNQLKLRQNVTPITS